VKWAGFFTTSGLTLLGYSEEKGIDVSVAFALSGTPGDLDRALLAAHFTTETSPGNGTFQSPPPLSGVDLSKLQGLRTAEDRWRNPEGHTLTRRLLRGATTEGQDLICVWAFTVG
jgi:hypothetical protein